MQNHHRELIWQTLRQVAIPGTQNATDACKALIELIPWYSWAKEHKTDHLLEDAVRAIAANTFKACDVFGNKWNSVYNLETTKDLPTAQFFVAAWASQETLNKYLKGN